MPRALRLALLWVGTTALAVTVSWFGVRLVLNAAVPDRAKPPEVGSLKTRTIPPPAGGATQKPSTSPTDGSSGADPTTSPIPRQSWVDGGTLNYQQTVATDGGWAVIRWNSSSVTVIDTYPTAGYRPQVVNTTATNVEIRFISAGKTTSITAWWKDGRPQLDVDNAPG